MRMMLFTPDLTKEQLLDKYSTLLVENEQLKTELLNAKASLKTAFRIFDPEYLLRLKQDAEKEESQKESQEAKSSELPSAVSPNSVWRRNPHE